MHNIIFLFDSLIIDFLQINKQVVGFQLFKFLIMALRMKKLKLYSERYMFSLKVVYNLYIYIWSSNKECDIQNVKKNYACELSHIKIYKRNETKL